MHFSSERRANEEAKEGKNEGKTSENAVAYSSVACFLWFTCKALSLAGRRPSTPKQYVTVTVTMPETGRAGDSVSDRADAAVGAACAAADTAAVPGPVSPSGQHHPETSDGQRSFGIRSGPSGNVKLTSAGLRRRVAALTLAAPRGHCGQLTLKQRPGQSGCGQEATGTWGN
jgi:hypothetical protein